MGLFLTQAPSFLASQRRLQAHKARTNAHTLFGVTPIPCDHHLRPRLAPIAPGHGDPVFLAVFERLAQHHLVESVRRRGEQLLVALDGTTSFASQAIRCPTCLTRQRSNGHTLSDHAAITPVVVGPGRSQVIAFPPEDSMPHDGHATQDGEQMAGPRWIQTQAAVLAPHQVTVLGDELYRTQPWCALALAQGCNCILVCQPDAPPQLSERVAFWPANDGIAAGECRHWHGRCTAVSLDRVRHDVLLGDGKDAVSVHGFEITVVNATTGAPLYHNSFLTHHRVTGEHVAAVVQAGRGRWKSENEHNHVLKTKGYQGEHNFGHGKESLSAVMCSLTLLALLCHTVLAWREDKSALLRRVLARRQTFFDDIRALTRSLVFDSWDHLIDFMLRGLELQSALDTG